MSLFFSNRGGVREIKFKLKFDLSDVKFNKIFTETLNPTFRSFYFPIENTFNEFLKHTGEDPFRKSYSVYSNYDYSIDKLRLIRTLLLPDRQQRLDNNIRIFKDRMYNKVNRQNIYNFISYIWTNFPNVDNSIKYTFLYEFLVLEVARTKDKLDYKSTRRTRRIPEDALYNYLIDPEYNNIHISFYSILNFVLEGIEKFKKNNIFNVYTFTLLMKPLKESIFYLYYELNNRASKESKLMEELNAIVEEDRKKDDYDIIYDYCNDINGRGHKINLLLSLSYHFKSIDIFDEQPKCFNENKKREKKIWYFYGKKFLYNPIDENEQLDSIRETIKKKFKAIYSYLNQFGFIGKKYYLKHKEDINEIIMDFVMFYVLEEEANCGYSVYNENFLFKQGSYSKEFVSSKVINDKIQFLQTGINSLKDKNLLFNLLINRKTMMNYAFLNSELYLKGKYCRKFHIEDIYENFLSSTNVSDIQLKYIVYQFATSIYSNKVIFSDSNIAYSFISLALDIIKKTYNDVLFNISMIKKFLEEIVLRKTGARLIDLECKVREEKERIGEDPDNQETYYINRIYTEVEKDLKRLNKHYDEFDTSSGNFPFIYCITLTTLTTEELDRYLNILHNAINYLGVNDWIKITKTEIYEFIMNYLKGYLNSIIYIKKSKSMEKINELLFFNPVIYDD